MKQFLPNVQKINFGFFEQRSIAKRNGINYNQSSGISLKIKMHISKILLVSTYVVCERLSVMHEPAAVVEILVQILQNQSFC